jgi:competence protein ComEC
VIAGHPRHAVLAAAVAGLVVAAVAPAFAVVAAGVAALAAGPGGPPRLAAGLALAVLVGAWAGQARLTALERTAFDDLPRLVTIRAVLLEPPDRRAHGYTVAPARVLGGRADGERIVLRLPPAGWRERARWPREPTGAVVVARGELHPLGPYDGAEARRHAHAVLQVRELRATGARRGGPVGVLDRVRARAEEALGSGIPGEQAALSRGMVLGQDHALSEEVQERMRATGLAHLVAASGANVALLAALVLALGALAGIPRTPRLVLAVVCVAAYVPLAGAGPSIQRAGVMGAAALVAALAGRPATRWYALLLAAAVTLLWNPRAVGDPGWQLSFAAVLALLLVAPSLRSALARRVPGALADPLAVTFAATLGTAPLLALHFERVSVVSPLMNVLAAPVVAPIMWLGTLASLAGQVAAGAARPFALLAAPLLGYLDWLAAWGAALPAAEVEPSARARIVLTAGCLVVVALAAHPRGRRLAARAVASRAQRGGAAVLAVACVAALALAVRPPGPPEGPRLSFLAIGQGDATLLQHGRHAVLVDTGRADGPVLELLRDAGVRRLDALVLTHGSADHEGAAAAILRAMPVGMLFDGGGPDHRTGGLRAAVAEARRRRIPVAETARGQTIRAGPIELRVLWPDRRRPPAPDADPNLYATVLDARLGGIRALLPADAESVVTTRLRIGTVDVLKVAHHGSGDPELPALLDQVRPRVAVIPVGPNTYGHPHRQTVGALRAGVPMVRRTDRDGTVRIVPGEGGAMTVGSAR